ncbi:ZYRO0A12892p [Zygosaccharomyces rouxii]|uniref:ZYRO0A12892p n=1 Tax=Zygosaccharomyces rouxii (strain ATCC 2623 / CBS 732 / NBRC 1130 / NCYC 568 / NRRL Y-229) TaxID=559307 RepID=C5DNZ4_ZYGRC|nr:uncharacterized protein ZYRO0A12892g [Zygosaccharomyces rouxii]CAR25985.1 ZYRO0A12892p [Zygosaccharomyces rouxii]
MGGEYECQYSNDQIRKKHKCWHDGKLKLRSDGKVALCDEDGSKLSVKREMGRWLDPKKFNQEFQFCSRFVVAITSLDEKPSLALPMRPFKTPRTLPIGRPAKPAGPARPARRTKVLQLQQSQMPSRTRARIRHVQVEPIRI